MEKNHENLKKAVGKLPGYEPDEELWNTINEKLSELPLNAAINTLPEYEPEEKLWDLIVSKASEQKPAFRWWHFAAAMVAVGLSVGLLTFMKNSDTDIAYSVETVDSRLQNNDLKVTDAQYQRLKAYCETETLVCNSKNYKRLQEEYEKLSDASVQLQQAMGAYNNEIELVQQFISLEEQKADILNEMAKMI